MVGFVIFLHVMTSLVLIFIVLLQTGKGAEMGAVFGSASSSVFGPTGPANILTKITVGAAILFMITSLYLSYSFSKPVSNTIVPKTKAPAQQQPATPVPPANIPAPTQPK